jgi:SAM-dependent methyltransferase
MNAPGLQHGFIPLPSEWLTQHAHLLPDGGHVLDVACGSGRHVRWLAERGFAVTAIDRDAIALAEIDALPSATVHPWLADIENAPWPLPNQTFDAVLVTNYLYRPLWPTLLAAVAPGGLLIYETFAIGNERFGKPSRPDFLLRPGELLDVVRDLFSVIAFEDCQVDTPKPAMIQRIVARRVTSLNSPIGAAFKG